MTDDIKTCLNCAHFSPEGNTCPSFPEGIPFAFLEGFYEHIKLVNGYAHKEATEDECRRNVRGYMGWDKK